MAKMRDKLFRFLALLGLEAMKVFRVPVFGVDVVELNVTSVTDLDEAMAE